MLAALQHAGYELESDPAACDVVIINTCGFIEDAKRESIDTILEFAQLKEAGSLRLLVVTGCLAERYRQELARELPETDVVLGIGSNDKIVEAISTALEGRRYLDFGPKEALPLTGERVLTTAPYTAYLKIAEGCDNRCSYCAIPLIRGGFRSRELEDVVEEAKWLAAQGVRELNVIAQDTTRYGEDRYGRPMLPELLRRLAAIDGIAWIRILYGYPDRISDELLDLIRTEDKIVNYIDIPLQHASGKILRAMNRRFDLQSLQALIARIRERVPGIAIRTTVMTGFPGETEEDFEQLCEFIRTSRFERLGCFAFSEEEGTPAAELPGQVDEAVRRARADIVMQLQAQIMYEINQGRVGQTAPVLVEGIDEETGMYVGRTALDAPDIDGRVYFTARRTCRPGEFVPVQIDEAVDYDLTGHAVGEGER